MHESRTFPETDRGSLEPVLRADKCSHLIWTLQKLKKTDFVLIHTLTFLLQAAFQSQKDFLKLIYFIKKVDSTRDTKFSTLQT